MFSFSKILPLDTPRALHQSMTIPAYSIVVTIVMLVVIIVASSISNSSSCTEMVADIESPDVLYTLVVCKTHGWW